MAALLDLLTLCSTQTVTFVRDNGASFHTRDADRFFGIFQLMTVAP